ncbi:MAG: pectate lyase, partial [Rhodanobacteraceae bacterium]
MDARSGLKAAAEWLARAQDATGSGGVSAFYDAAKRQWAGAYPETTGYIIPTFFRYADFSGQPEYRERAIRMAAWESDIQLPDGGVRAGTLDAKQVVPTIFNTGQVLFGWRAAWRQTGDTRFRDSLVRAADWLVAAQDPDGAWRRFASPFASHALNSYNTRVAFALAQAGRDLQQPRYVEAAV